MTSTVAEPGNAVVGRMSISKLICLKIELNVILDINEANSIINK